MPNAQEIWEGLRALEADIVEYKRKEKADESPEALAVAKETLKKSINGFFQQQWVGDAKTGFLKTTNQNQVKTVVLCAVHGDNLEILKEFCTDRPGILKNGSILCAATGEGNEAMVSWILEDSNKIDFSSFSVFPSETAERREYRGEPYPRLKRQLEQAEDKAFAGTHKKTTEALLKFVDKTLKHRWALFPNARRKLALMRKMRKILRASLKEGATPLRRKEQFGLMRNFLRVAAQERWPRDRYSSSFFGKSAAGTKSLKKFSKFISKLFTNEGGEAKEGAAILLNGVLGISSKKTVTPNLIEEKTYQMMEKHMHRGVSSGISQELCSAKYSTLVLKTMANCSDTDLLKTRSLDFSKVMQNQLESAAADSPTAVAPGEESGTRAGPGPGGP